MGWIGLRQDNTGAARATGPGCVMPQPPIDPDALQPRGTLLCEFIHRPAPTRRNIIRYSSRIPIAASLYLCIDPDGTAHLFSARNGVTRAVALATSLGQTSQNVVASLSWDSTARTGLFSLYLPETGGLHLTRLTDLLPMTHRDLHRILMDSAACQIAPDVAFVALSNSVEPVGPIATLGSSAHIATPDGPRPVKSLRLGQSIITADGNVAQVRWAGSQELPACGQFAPLLIRAPYFGLTNDLHVAPSQRLRLKGSVVEYLFGEEEVFASAGHLLDGRAIVRAPYLQTIRYHQVLLDRPGILQVSGSAMETIDIAPLCADPTFQQHSLLAAVPRELMPKHIQSGQMVLRAFEAITLAAARAA